MSSTEVNFSSHRQWKNYFWIEKVFLIFSLKPVLASMFVMGSACTMHRSKVLHCYSREDLTLYQTDSDVTLTMEPVLA
jgi:hypothetical protein